MTAFRRPVREEQGTRELRGALRRIVARDVKRGENGDRRDESIDDNRKAEAGACQRRAGHRRDLETSHSAQCFAAR